MFHKHSLILTVILSMVTSFGLFAQNRTVTGVVRDSKGEPLMGAGVMLDGTTRGTVTDLNGAFSLPDFLCLSDRQSLLTDRQKLYFNQFNHCK